MAEDLQEWSQTDTPGSGQNPRVLWSQQLGVKIRSITIANGTTATNVQVYRNAQEAPSGQPAFTVGPNSAVTLPIQVFDGVTIQYVPQPGKQLDGTVYIHVTNQVLAASGTAGGSVIGPSGVPFSGNATRVFGINSIVASKGASGNYDTVGILSGLGPPGFVAPVGTLYQDQTNGDLWMAKTFTPGAIGFNATQFGDGVWNLYKLSADAKDSGPGGQDGTIAGGVTFPANPLEADLAGSALFDGSTGKITLPFQYPPNTHTGFLRPYAIEFLWSCDGLGVRAGTSKILGNSNGNTQFSVSNFWPPTDNNHIAFITGGINQDSGNLGTVRAYHHMVYSFDGTSTVFYADNNRFYVGPGDAMTQNADFGNVLIGASGTTFGHAYMNSVGFYKTGLTDAQVAAHWAAITNPGASSWKKFQQV